SSNKKKINRPVIPEVKIAVNGKEISLPLTPVRSTNENGIVGYDVYEATYKAPQGTKALPKVTAWCDNRGVKITVTQP
ncbi:hypothetical protein ABTD17_19225, partial [Acinetobacter baumannii]